MTVFQANEKSVGAQNQFTEAIDPLAGFLAISVGGFLDSPAFVGTVTLQRSFDDASTWKDVDSYTADEETMIDAPVSGIFYRLGVKTGDYTSGTANVGLYK